MGGYLGINCVCRFEVVLRHSEEKLLIPTRLPKAKPPQASLPPTAAQPSLTPTAVECKYIQVNIISALDLQKMAF